MIGYLARNTIGKGVVSLFSFLNYTIYLLVKHAFVMVIEIANVTFNDNLLGDFQTRMYMVVAIYMLFKLAFSLISSIVNPEKLLDKQTGMQKIIPRTIISLCMLIMMPTIFSFAMDAQNTIVAFVPRIILGKKVDTSTSGIAETADSVAAAALSAFITTNNECSDNPTVDYNDPNFEATINVNSLSEAIDYAYEACSSSKKVFKYEFSFFVSLIAGIILIVTLISYCVDVSIRVIKLGLLKILSPIPVISYIDPKSEKGGAFGNWLKECISTYTELFVKMGVLYFALYLLGNISSSEISLFNIPEGGVLVRVMLIIGVFMFMGRAAEFICNIIGIKYNKGSGGMLGKALSFGAGSIAGAALGAGGAILGGAFSKDGGGLHTIRSAALHGAGSHGKPLDGFNKGRDIAAQIKTGNPNEKHKNFLEKRANKLNEKRAAKLGFTNESLDQAKAAMYNARDEMNNAAAMRDRFNSGTFNDSDEDFVNALRQDEKYANMSTSEILDAHYNSSSSNYGKAEKHYSDAKAYAGVLGVKTSEPLGSKFSGGFNPKEYEPEIRRSKYVATRNTSSQSTQQTASAQTTSVPTESVYDRINRTANVHDAPTREEHNQRQAELNELFFSDAGKNYLDANERETDKE